MAHTDFIIIKDSWKTASFSLQVIGAWVWEHTVLCGQADCLLNPFLNPMAKLDATLYTWFQNVLSASRQVVTLSRLNQLVCSSCSRIDLTHVRLQFHLSGSLNCDL